MPQLAGLGRAFGADYTALFAFRRLLHAGTSHKRGIAAAAAFRYNLRRCRIGIFLMKTLYELLGVRRQASHIEIELGYRRHLNRHLLGLGMQPLSRRAKQKLQAVRQAYLVLSSPGRRQAYDLDLTQREQRRDRMLDIGGAIIAVSALVIGMGLIVASPYFPAWPDFSADISQQIGQVFGTDAARPTASPASVSSSSPVSTPAQPHLASAR